MSKFYNLFLLVLIFLQPATLHSETLKAGFFHLPPHQYINKKGELRGAVVSYFNLIAKKMAYDVEWVGPLPLTRLVHMMKNGTVDVYPLSLQYPDMDDFMYFANTPFYFAQGVLAVSINNPLNKIESFGDIRNLKINWLDTVPASPFIKENSKQLQIELTTPTKHIWKQLLSKLTLGRVDAVHDLNTFTLPFEAKRWSLDKKIKILLLPDKPTPILVTFSKLHPNGKQLIEQYNQIHETMKFGHDDYIELVNKELKQFE